MVSEKSVMASLLRQSSLSPKQQITGRKIKTQEGFSFSGKIINRCHDMAPAYESAPYPIFPIPGLSACHSLPLSFVPSDEVAGFLNKACTGITWKTH